MTCEETANLISARVDGELASGDKAALDAHLAGCSACRATLAEMELQDAALLRAFSPRQEAAGGLADRISQAIAEQSAAVCPMTSGGVRSLGSRARITVPFSGLFGCHFPRLRGHVASGRDNLPDPKKHAHASVGHGTHHERTGQVILARSFIRHFAGWTAAAAAGFVAAIVLLKPANHPPASFPSATVQPAARLILATGIVYTNTSDQQTWRPIQAGAAIDRGTAIRTADAAKCELLLPDGSCMRMDSGTEARFAGDRDVQVSAGQVWSAVPRNALPICVSSGQTSVIAGGTSNDLGTEFELACAAHAATVTVQRGTADVTGNGPRTVIHGGQILRAPSKSAVFSCTAILDPVQAVGWQDELLTLKPGDDPEVIARVNQLLARVSTDQGPAGAVCPIEQEIRAHGQSWSTSIACILQKPAKNSDPDTRRIAARLLSDLATSSNVPDLIALLADEQSEVRYHAAAALRRLTGQTLGYSPDDCAATRNPAAIAAWRNWWAQNKSRYPAAK